MRDNNDKMEIEERQREREREDCGMHLNGK